MTRYQLNVGKIVQTGLNFINNIQEIQIYEYEGSIITESGVRESNYAISPTTARIQPVDQKLLFKHHLEFGHTYKRFYILINNLNTVNRNIKVNSDYIYYDELYYRVMHVDDNFKTGWLHVIGMQTNEAPNG